MSLSNGCTPQGQLPEVPTGGITADVTTELPEVPTGDLTAGL